MKKLLTLIVLLCFTIFLSSCGDEVDTCTFIVNTKEGSHVYPDLEYRRAKYTVPLTGEFTYEGLYLDPEYTTLATEDSCVKDAVIYVKTELVDFSIELIKSNDETVSIDTVFQGFSVYGYTTTDNRVFIAYRFSTPSGHQFIDVTEYLNLREHETVISISQSHLMSFFLTSDHRILILQNFYQGAYKPQFTPLLQVDAETLDNYDVMDMEDHDGYLYFLTTNHKLYRFESNMIQDIQDEPTDITEEIKQDIIGSDIIEMFYTTEGNDRIILVDDEGNVYVLRDNETEYSLSVITNDYGIPNQLIKEMYQNNQNTLVYENEVYSLFSSSILKTSRPEHMISLDETPIKAVEFYPFTLYLTDEHLYYYYTTVDVETGQINYGLYGDMEYLILDDLVPLEPDESIIDVNVLNNYHARRVQIVVYTNQGHVYISEEFSSHLNIESEDWTHPTSSSTFTNIEDAYFDDTVDTITTFFVFSNRIQLFDVAGNEYLLGAYMGDEQSVHTTYILPSIKLTIDILTYNTFDVVEEVIYSFFGSENYQLYNTYLENFTSQLDTLESNKNYTFFYE